MDSFDFVKRFDYRLQNKSLRFKGSSTSSRSTLSKTQRDTQKAWGEWVIPKLKERAGGTALPADLQIADMPDYYKKISEDYAADFPELYKKASGWLDEQASGKPAYTHDPAAITQDWQENFANPSMMAWSQYVAPAIKNSMAFSGNTMFGSNVGRTVGEQGSQFMAQNITPTLYNTQEASRFAGITSKENAANRVLPAVGMSSQIYGEMSKPLLDTYNLQEGIRSGRAEDWLRVNAQEMSPWLKLAMGGMNQPTQENIVKQDTNWLADIAQIGMSGAYLASL